MPVCANCGHEVVPGQACSGGLWVLSDGSNLWPCGCADHYPEAEPVAEDEEKEPA